MTDESARSPFDLEPGAASDLSTPRRAPRREVPERRSTRRGKRSAGPAPAIELGADRPGGFRSLDWVPRALYGLSAVMALMLLFARFNPSFGTAAPLWFWQILGGTPTGHTYTWNPVFIQALFMPFAALALLAAVCTGPSEGRARWIAVWCVLTFITYRVNRGVTFQLLLPLVAVVGLGLLVRTGRGHHSTRSSLILLIVLGGFMFSPLIGRAAGPSTSTPTDSVMWECQAKGIVDGITNPPPEPDDPDASYLSRLSIMVLLFSPQIVALLTLLLMAVAITPLRGPWLAWTGLFLLLSMLGLTAWLTWDAGLSSPLATQTAGPAWWRGLGEMTDAWRGRFTVFMPAMVGCLAEIGTRRDNG